MSLTSAISGSTAVESGGRRQALLCVADKTLLRTSRILAVLGAAALALMLLLICANIVMRPFGESIRGTAELGGYICALALGLSMPFSQLGGAHIGAGLWNRSLPKRVRFVMDVLVNLGCAFVLALAAYEIFGVALYGLEMGDYIDGFEFSYFPMAAALALGLLLQGAVFLRSLVLFLAGPGRAEAA